MLAEGASFNTIKQRLRTTAPTISRWKQRFLASGIDGLDTSHPGQPASVLTAKLRARILSVTRHRGRRASDIPAPSPVVGGGRRKLSHQPLSHSPLLLAGHCMGQPAHRRLTSNHELGIPSISLPSRAK